MEPRISSLIDPALLSKKSQSRNALSLAQHSSELPFDAVRSARYFLSPADSRTQPETHSLAGKDESGSAKQADVSSKQPASSITLAEVLNSEQDASVMKDSLSFMLQDPQNRRKRKIDGNDRLKLPQLPAPAKKLRRPRIPPLLPGLYEPPPDAGLFPAITTDAPASQAPVPPTVVSQPHPLPSSQSSTAPPPSEEASFVVAAKSDADVKVQEGKTTTGVAELKSGFIVLEFPGFVKPKKKGPKKPKSDQKRRHWTNEETNTLLKGVAQFGIGKWTSILAFNSEILTGRSAQDLKDRFRICCPEQYRNSTTAAAHGNPSTVDGQSEKVICGTSEAEPPLLPANSIQSSKRRTHRKCLEDLADLGIEEPFRKSSRRQRRPYTDDEDEALLNGFLKHGPQWMKIKEDPDLKLSHRTSNDLRDHFRNTHPEKYAEAGFKLHGGLLAKHQHQDQSAKVSKAETPTEKATEPESSSQVEQSNVKSTNVPISTKNSAPTNVQPPLMGSSSLASKNKANQPKPLEFLLDEFEDDILDIDANDFVDPTPLNRTILDWADQNIPHVVSSAEGLPSIFNFMQASKSVELPSFTHIDPSATLKPPAGPTSKQSQKYVPSVPLSGIITDSNVKNTTFSLPPAADLMIGLEPENQSGGGWGAELRRLFE